jgi:hypothetical protein
VYYLYLYVSLFILSSRAQPPNSLLLNKKAERCFVLLFNVNSTDLAWRDTVWLGGSRNKPIRVDETISSYDIAGFEEDIHLAVIQRYIIITVCRAEQVCIGNARCVLYQISVDTFPDHA